MLFGNMVWQYGAEFAWNITWKANSFNLFWHGWKVKYELCQKLYICKVTCAWLAVHGFNLLKADFILNTFKFNSFELRQFLWFVNSSHKLIHNSGDLTQMALKDNQHGCAVENSFTRALLYFSQTRKQSLVNEPSDWNEMRLSLFFACFPSLNTLRDSIHVKNQRRWPGVFTWENAHQREFHAGWVLDLLLRLYICKFSHHHMSIVTMLSWIDENYACITHSSPAPEWNSTSGTATAWRELVPVRQFLVVSCKRIQNHERKPGWTHPGIM